MATKTGLLDILDCRHLVVHSSRHFEKIGGMPVSEHCIPKHVNLFTMNLRTIWCEGVLRDSMHRDPLADHRWKMFWLEVGSSDA